MSTRSSAPRRRRPTTKTGGQKDRPQRSYGEGRREQPGAQSRPATAPGSAKRSTSVHPPLPAIASPERSSSAAQPPVQLPESRRRLFPASAPVPVPDSFDQPLRHASQRQAALLELADEESLTVPVFVATASTPRRTWLPWGLRLRGMLPLRSPFRWHERDWSDGPWLQAAKLLPAAAVVLVTILLAGTLAVMLATHAMTGVRLQTQTTVSTPVVNPNSDVILQQPSQEQTPPPAPQHYMIGAWISGFAPGSSGSVRIVVRVSHDTQPVAGATVTLYVQFPGYGSNFGPVRTDQDGMAIIPVRYSGVPAQQPVFVTATAVTAGQTLTANTTFVPD